MCSSTEFEDCEDELGLDLSEALPAHTWEDIFSRIPLNSLGFSSCVCKRWRSLISSPSFLALHNLKHDQESWLYVNGFKYRVTDAHTRLSPSEFESTTCSSLSSSSPDPAVPHVSWGPGGLCYVLLGKPSQQKVMYKMGVLDKQWVETSEVWHPRSIPIVGVVKNPRSGVHKLVCVGGLPCDGTKESLLKVEMFSSDSMVWEECQDLPAEFKGLATYRSVTAAVCNQKLYIFHIYSGIVSSYDVEKKRWSEVKYLRPPGAQYCYLAVQYRSLLLIGVSYENDSFVFKGWKVDDSAMECTGSSQPVVCHFTGLKKSIRSFPSIKEVQEVHLTRPLSSCPNSWIPPGLTQSWALQYFTDIAKCMPKSTLTVGTKLFDFVFGPGRF